MEKQRYERKVRCTITHICDQFICIQMTVIWENAGKEFLCKLFIFQRVVAEVVMLDTSHSIHYFKCRYH